MISIELLGGYRRLHKHRPGPTGPNKQHLLLFVGLKRCLFLNIIPADRCQQCCTHLQPKSFDGAARLKEISPFTSFFARVVLFGRCLEDPVASQCQDLDSKAAVARINLIKRLGSQPSLPGSQEIRWTVMCKLGFGVGDVPKIEYVPLFCVGVLSSRANSSCWPSANSQFWKPPTLRFPVLVPTISITGAIIILLGLLLWKSQQDGGVLFAANINDLSTICSFMYLYLPTLIAVMYSMLWSWIDLDVKRLEPFFQLSNSRGAAAADSVLLHYPVDFLAAVPIRAAGRK